MCWMDRGYGKKHPDGKALVILLNIVFIDVIWKMYSEYYDTITGRYKPPLNTWIILPFP